MRWTIAAACVSTFVLGVVILAATPGFERLPPGGRAIPYIGVALAWGFVGVGAYAWLRRPDNRTGALMTLVGVGSSRSPGLQLFDVPALWVIGALVDTLIVSVLVHLLLAFPSGRRRGPRRADRRRRSPTPPARWSRRCCCSRTLRGRDCPSNPVLIADDATIAGAIVGVSRRPRGGRASSATVVVLAAPLAGVHPGAAARAGAGAAARRGDRCVLGLATALAQALGGAPPSAVADRVHRRVRARSRGVPARACVRTPLLPHRHGRRALIEQLAADRDLRDALADALGDPTLDVAYWLPERGYVDREGARDRAAAGRELTEIDHEGRRVGALLHDGGAGRDARALVEAAPPRRWRSRTRGWRSSCARGWRRCARRARGWSRRATRSGGGSAATCTTARSSGSSR